MSIFILACVVRGISLQWILKENGTAINFLKIKFFFHIHELECFIYSNIKKNRIFFFNDEFWSQCNSILYFKYHYFSIFCYLKNTFIVCVISIGFHIRDILIKKIYSSAGIEPASTFVLESTFWSGMLICSISDTKSLNGFIFNPAFSLLQILSLLIFTV